MTPAVWPYPMEFFVPGDPAPQGSKTATWWGGMRESSIRLSPWRDLVAQMAMLSRHNHTYECRLRGSYTFFLNRDADLDKLVRGANDGLQHGLLVKNDSLIFEFGPSKKILKREWPPGSESGCRIKLEPL